MSIQNFFISKGTKNIILLDNFKGIIKVKAIILSAGEGSRMRPLTLTKPKTMLPVAGKPIIQYNIESLRDNGITDILLIVRYKEEMVREYFGDGSDFGVPTGASQGSMSALGYSQSWTIGTGGAVGEAYLSKTEKIL